MDRKRKVENQTKVILILTRKFINTVDHILGVSEIHTTFISDNVKCVKIETTNSFHQTVSKICIK